MIGGMEQVSREQAKRLHHLRKIDQRALRMAAQGTLQQAIQAIMAVSGCTRVLTLELYLMGWKARPPSSLHPRLRLVLGITDDT